MVLVFDKAFSSLFLPLNQNSQKHSYSHSLIKLNTLLTSNNANIKLKRSCLTWALSADHNNPTDTNNSNSNAKNKKNVSHSNYVVPFDSSSCITRPLAEILRDLNKRIPDNIIIKTTSSSVAALDHEGGDQLDEADVDHSSKTYIPWYHANRMLSFYAPGWCGEIRDVIFSDNGSVTVVYRVTIRGSDGEAHRESTGTVSPPINGHIDAVAAAEEIAFCRACARFGLGLYLYHDE